MQSNTRHEEQKVNKHSIIATPHIAETAAVALAYADLEVAISEVQTSHTLYKDANGNLCENADFIPATPTGDDRRKMKDWEYHQLLRTIEEKKLEREQRRVTLYGCKLRWLSAISGIAVARNSLIEAVNALRTAIDSNSDPKLRLQVDAARCNVVFAELLLLSAHNLSREMSKSSSYGLDPHEHYAGSAGRLDLAAALTGEYERTRREWVVKYSGQGSSYRFEGGDGTQVPEGPYQTFEEARDDGAAWESNACTIGGGALLYNVRTQKEVGRF